jgi:predicted PurR-regulated permease PerM
MSDDRPTGTTLRHTVSWATLFKILIVGLLALIAIKLLPLVEILILGLLIAITFWPVMRWTAARGWPKWSGVSIAALVLLGFVVVFLGVLIPALGEQASGVIKNLPAFKEHLLSRLSGPIRVAAARLMDAPSFADPAPLMNSFLAWGTLVVEALAKFLLVLAVAIYLVADGARVFQWLLAFFPVVQRRKVAVAAPEIAEVVSSYMAGQLITSLLCAGYVFGMLTLLHVPNALLLAVLAGIFDVLPIIGFFLAVVPAAAVALTVAPGTAFLVFVLYLAYHLIENYFIVPKIYGNRLRLSTLTVLVSCLAGALLAGVTGAIAILPIVACYPIIERIWLRPLLEPDTVATHEAIDEHEHGEENRGQNDAAGGRDLNRAKDGVVP